MEDFCGCSDESVLSVNVHELNNNSSAVVCSNSSSPKLNTTSTNNSNNSNSSNSNSIRSQQVSSCNNQKATSKQQSSLEKQTSITEMVEGNTAKPCSDVKESRTDHPINKMTKTTHELQQRREYSDTVRKHEVQIGDFERCGNDYKIVNMKMNGDFTYRDLERSLKGILSEMTDTFSLNIGFGFILHNSSTGEFKYFFDAPSHMLYSKPITVRHSADLVRFVRQVEAFDLREKYYLDMAPSVWQLVGLTNVQVQVSFIDEASVNTTTQKVVPPKRRPSFVRPFNHGKRLKPAAASPPLKNSTTGNQLQFNFSDDLCSGVADNLLLVCIADNSKKSAGIDMGVGLLQTCMVR